MQFELFRHPAGAQSFNLNFLAFLELKNTIWTFTTFRSSKLQLEHSRHSEAWKMQFELFRHSNAQKSDLNFMDIQKFKTSILNFLDIQKFNDSIWTFSTFWSLIIKFQLLKMSYHHLVAFFFWKPKS